MKCYNAKKEIIMGKNKLYFFYAKHDLFFFLLV